MNRLLHLMGSLEVGGKERVVLQLARRARSEGLDHRLLLFDHPFRNRRLDFEPGDVPTEFIPRRPGFDLRFPLLLARRLRELHTEVLHAHNDTALCYGALARCLVRRHRVALVATFHALPTHGTRSARALTYWASRRATRVTAVSRELASRLQDSGWLEHCETVCNGIDLGEFNPEGPGAGLREQLSIPAHSRIVGHVGRFVPVKRQRDLLRAARLLRERDLEPTLVFVGQGPDLESTQHESRDLSTVRFLPRSLDVAGLLRELDLLVLCSEHEAAPRILLEAMACGCPVVATDVGGVREMMTPPDGEPCGLLIPAGRPDLLADAISSLLREPSRLERLALEGRRRAEFYSCHREWARYREIFETVTQAGPRHVA